MYLGQTPDADITLRAGDTPILLAHAFQESGANWFDGYEGFFTVRRSSGDLEGEWVFDTLVLATPYLPHIFVFMLEGFTEVPGDYEGFLTVVNESSDYPSPIDMIFTFDPFPIKVLK